MPIGSPFAAPHPTTLQRIGWWILLPLLALAAIFLPTVARAEGEELDPTFGVGGVVRIAPHSSSAQSHEVAGLLRIQDTIVAAVNLTNTVGNTPAGAMIMLLDANGKALNPPAEIATTAPITQEEGLPLVNHIDYGFLGSPADGGDTLTARLLSNKSWINLPVLLKAK